MPEEVLSEKYRAIIHFIEKVGVLAFLCGVLLWFMGTQFREFRSNMEWALSRSIRNERAIMQKLNIPVQLEGDRKE
jgi:hypothetical protein